METDLTFADNSSILVYDNRLTYKTVLETGKKVGGPFSPTCSVGALRGSSHFHMHDPRPRVPADHENL